MSNVLQGGRSSVLCSDIYLSDSVDSLAAMNYERTEFL